MWMQKLNESKFLVENAVTEQDFFRELMDTCLMKK